MARILVADDNPALANVLRFHLERAGHEVIVTGNGVDAFRQASTQPFDLLLTDHQMPKLSGLELCAALRDEPSTAELPILLLTAKRLELNIEQLQAEYGVRQVFAKPFSPAELVRVVQELLPTPVG